MLRTKSTIFRVHGGRAAAAVQQIPAEDRRVVLVRDVRVDVDVVEERAMCSSTSPITVGSVQNGAMSIERAVRARRCRASAR